MTIFKKHSLRAGNTTRTRASELTLKQSIYPLALHFQNTLGITKARSSGLQAAYFGAYPLASLGHANWLLRHYGFKIVFIWGLFLYGVGALIAWPCILYRSFGGFCAATFIIGNGLGSLETAANPYITICGPPRYSELRINFSQAFNGIGTVVAPVLGSYVFFKDTGDNTDSLKSVQWVYLAIACFVFLLAVVFYFITRNYGCRHGIPSRRNPRQCCRQTILAAISPVPCRFCSILLHRSTSCDRELLHQLCCRNDRLQRLPSSPATRRCSRSFHRRSLRWSLHHEICQSSLGLPSLSQFGHRIHLAVDWCARKRRNCNAIPYPLLRIYHLPNHRRAGNAWPRKILQTRLWFHRRRSRRRSRCASSSRRSSRRLVHRPRHVRPSSLLRPRLVLLLRRKLHSSIQRSH
ncbi:Glucose/galactose transporter [Cercospora beticola]|uniref:Glucose/galactose transporter n=1 Tax=Cercospora beticola TaxID=122368 RepID=A0A2G5ID32_CERBT|nr:Glucose/galactose transporter [Cercospora beticola]PIB02434.1 Glucose/galactose transporter [Cercospora beticola]